MKIKRYNIKKTNKKIIGNYIKQYTNNKYYLIKK